MDPEAPSERLQDNKNPRDPAAVMAALARVQARHSCHFTPATARDLKQFGLQVPGIVTPAPAGLSTAIVIAGFFLIEEGLHFPDNLLGKCRCGLVIQWRPHSPPGERLCLFCAADLPANLKPSS